MKHDVLNTKENKLLAINFLMAEHQDKVIFPSEEKINLIEKTLYVNKELPAIGGSFALLSSGLNNDIGSTNFDGDKLGDGRAFVISQLGVFIGVAPKGTKPQNVEYKKMESSNAKAFQFAEITLRQGDVLLNKNIMSITKSQKDLVGYLDVDYSLLRPGNKIELDITIPSGVEASDLKEGEVFYISVQFNGYETYNKR